MPPMLGIFNDIPNSKVPAQFSILGEVHTSLEPINLPLQIRDDEAHSWAKAGFTWVVNDGEHQVYEGRYGLEQNQAQLRAGLTPVQRFHREAISEHGDAFQKGARYMANRTAMQIMRN